MDYRDGDEAVVKGIQAALKGQKLGYAYDAVSEKGSVGNLGKVVDTNGGKITFVLPGKKYTDELAVGIETSITRVGDVHGTPDDLWEFGFVHWRYIAKGLREGWFKPQPHEVVPGGMLFDMFILLRCLCADLGAGLEGVQQGLQNLKDGKASAVKYIFKIADTPGLSS